MSGRQLSVVPEDNIPLTGYDGQLNSVEDIQRLMERVTRDVVDAKMDYKTAQTLTMVARVVLKCCEMRGAVGEIDTSKLTDDELSREIAKYTRKIG
jgi:hypothetical protein